MGSGYTKFMSSGDFNGDKKDDIALFYDYGNYQMGIWTFISNGQTVSPILSFQTQPSSWDVTHTKFMASGDFNNDGKDDVALYYDLWEQSNGFVEIYV